ncbi:glycosyl transferase family 90 [Spiribacter vilamensis]|uniref:Glycosyl transferase family 90 n=1 Tax=Spiribacter vilamensis TaxID=531306 RepID=A0A4Q8D286_9GAMM|nr:glycosyl transferase family 90 [Spiribacter vilamensis]RZU99407.1 glycosyl transferase family 90 [Spiribacter vilamensis]TVO61618.1 lipopolysaccharide A protein [Spiribacter vilamensis]
MLKDKLRKNRHKLTFYLKGISEIGLPRSYYINQRKRWFKCLEAHRSEGDIEDIQRRVNYYNQWQKTARLASGAERAGDFTKGKSWAYYIDMKRYLMAFDPSVRLFYQPGDVTRVTDQLTFLKSRPIRHDNHTSVLLKLNRVRHYFFVNDQQPFEHKKNLLVWRGGCHQQHRKEFVKRFCDHPLCDVGDSRQESSDEVCNKGFLGISQQLGYKFILSIEGNDVATNLKWIMASNSLCFMTKPKFETWFMEGALVAGFHYVQVSDDYSDLDSKVQYYIDHPEQAKAIVRNANNYVKPFLNEPREHLIGLLVMQKYFEKTEQTTPLGLRLWE